MKKRTYTEEEKVRLLVSYRLLFPKGWTTVVNKELPSNALIGKESVVGIYKAILSINKKNNVIPTIRELVKRGYGKDKQKLDEETIRRYLREMVDAMQRIIASRNLFSNPLLTRRMYLGGLLSLRADNELYFEELSKINGTLEYGDREFSIRQKLYFHPLYDSHDPKAVSLFKEVIDNHRYEFYLERLKLELQIIEANRTKQAGIMGLAGVGDMLDFLENTNYTDSHTIMFYSMVLRYERKHPQGSKIDLFGIIEKFSNSAKANNLPTDYEAAYIYNLICNALNRLGRKGIKGVLEMAVELNDTCMGTPALLVDGILPYGHFLNVAFKKCDLNLSNPFPKNVADIISYVKGMSKFLSTPDRKRGLRLACKYIYFKHGDYKAGNKIAMHTYPNFIDRILYESFELGELFHLSQTEEDATLFHSIQKSHKNHMEKNRTKFPSIQTEGYLIFLDSIKTLFQLRKKIVFAHGAKKAALESKFIDEQERIKSLNGYVFLKDWLIHRDRMHI